MQAVKDTYDDRGNISGSNTFYIYACTVLLFCHVWFSSISSISILKIGVLKNK